MAIVGAGISGACMARALARPGRRVALLDRRVPMMGSTAASTALLSYEIDQPMIALSTQVGADRAMRAWQRSFAAIGQLREMVRSERIRCAWSDRDALYLAGDVLGPAELAAEARSRNDVGLPGAYLTAQALGERFGLARAGAIASTGSAVANPLQLTGGVLRSAVRSGARIHSPVDVTTVDARGGEVRITTSSGITITAGHAVFCTGYELLPGVPSSGHAIVSTWAFASAPGAVYPAWLDRTIVWEASEPYLYVRTARGRRLIVGGEDAAGPSRHADRRLLAAKVRSLAAKVRALVPGTRFTPEYCWGGSFGDADTGLPLIDRVPGMDRCHVVMGFGGNGFVNSVIASQVVAAAIDGHVDPDADLYRLPPA